MNIYKDTLINTLEAAAYRLRRSSLIMTSYAGSGHPTSCLSAADLVAALFFHTMRFDPRDHTNPSNDRFILSKGHAVPLLYAVYYELGILNDNDLKTIRTLESCLEGHPTPRFPYVDVATGSLGMGLSMGAGMALEAHLDNLEYTTYVLLGDGEIAEGSVWEAAELAAYHKLSNLVAIVDCNRLGQTGETRYKYSIEEYQQQFEAFGWYVHVVDGHSMANIVDTYDSITNNQTKATQPIIVLAKTRKGHGLSTAEDKLGFHGKAFAVHDLPSILDNLAHNYPTVAAAQERQIWHITEPKLPVTNVNRPKAIIIQKEDTVENSVDIVKPMATRRAFGEALVLLGGTNDAIVALDGDVGNSTYTELFKKVYPERFIQCFIAEQNMVGMAIGLHARGKIPFVATFAAFLTRAYDQLRMAAIGRNAIRCVGSHAGISIGEDGPSQMGLEDISMFYSLPDSIILYPADTLSAHALTKLMSEYSKGISYLRTTREETPLVYTAETTFHIGGSHILRQSDHDALCIIGAGITLIEALRAHDILQTMGIASTIIDVYSVKPLDTETLLRAAQAAHNIVLTIEDHYLSGGIGQHVAYELRNHEVIIECLAVRDIPQSGNPQKLRAQHCIDAEAIVTKALTMVNKK